MKTSPIVNLPNEVLYEILRLLSVHALKPRPDRDFRTIMTLRSVCRRFRMITDELPFWHKDCDFDLVDIISKSKKIDNFRYNFWARTGDILHAHEEFLEVLLANQHLVHNLVRRTKWHFRSFISFQSVKELVPSFFENTTAVGLECGTVGAKFGVISEHDSSDLPDVPPRYRIQVEYRHLRLDSETGPQSPIELFFINLGHCHRLTSLQLSHLPDPIDLNFIAKYCPLLKTLRLRDMRNCSGSLSDLCSLEDLHIRPFFRFQALAVVSLLPTASTKSLTRLSIIADVGFGWPLPFSCPFANLTALCLCPATTGTCQSITNSKFRLIDLCIQFTFLGRVELEMFSAPSLRNLQRLRIVVGWKFEIPYPSEDPKLTRLVEAISALRPLEDLWISMGLNLLWCQHLGKLVNLKVLFWSYPDDDCRHGENLLFATQLHGQARQKKYTKKAFSQGIELVKATFDAAFQVNSKKPEIYTRIRRREEHDHTFSVTKFIDPDLPYSDGPFKWLDERIELGAWNHIDR